MCTVQSQFESPFCDEYLLVYVNITQPAIKVKTSPFLICCSLFVHIDGRLSEDENEPLIYLSICVDDSHDEVINVNIGIIRHHRHSIIFCTLNLF